MERNHQVDVAKGLGIFFVIIGHLMTYGHPLSRWIFGFHMPLFFFLSGYVFKYDTERFGKVICKVLISLLVPYFFVCLFGLCVTLIIPGWRNFLYLKDIFLQVFYFVQPECLHVGQVWFLFCLAVVQILFVFLKKVKLSELAEFLFVVFSFALSIGFSYIYQRIGGGQIFGHTIPRPPFKIDTALMGLVFFWLGNKDCERKVVSGVNEKSLFSRISIFIVIFVVNVMYTIMLKDTVNLANNYYKNAVFFILASVTGVYFVLIFSGSIGESKVLIFYGKNSLAIFAFHSMFLYLYQLILTKIFHRPIFIMNNIPLWLCFVGLVFVALCSIPIPFIYKCTIGKLTKALKEGLTV